MFVCALRVFAFIAFIRFSLLVKLFFDLDGRVLLQDNAITKKPKENFFCPCPVSFSSFLFRLFLVVCVKQRERERRKKERKKKRERGERVSECVSILITRAGVC